ncbi:MAG: hypothetical protein IKM02_01780 [Clostridia bacterium]|nr:hypothetical protein [Clostridia bacterium]
MLKLKNIISDHALFQQNTLITVSGWGKPCAEIKLCLMNEAGEGKIFSVLSNDNGRFDIPVTTPEGGWKAWKMTISDGEEDITVQDILFGDVWLAAGQSNMEMPLSEVPDREEVRPELKGVRFFQNNPEIAGGDDWGHDPATWGTPRREDAEDAVGFWGSDLTKDRQDMASCLALVACAEMSKAQGMPVGFVNYNLGGSSIETWLPYTRMDEFPEVAERIRDLGLWPDENCRNCSMIYHNVAPGIYGMKFRGVMWYQGETNTCYKDAKGYYRDALLMWYEVYSDLFATEKGFPMLCALLYPWIYGENTTNRCAVNGVITELAARQPEKFCAIPTYDLPPVWSINLNNHPIHPAHKTALGRRFAKAALAACGYEGMKSCAWMKNWRAEDGRIVMVYETFGRALEAKGELDGFMVCGSDGVWQHAQAEIISETEVAVWNEAIAEPVSAMYQYLDTQLDGGLWCGDMSAAPAATCDVQPAPVQMRPWTDLKKDSVWVIDRTIADDSEGGWGKWKILEAYFRPTWRAGEGCEICRDTAFARTGCALRIAGETSPVSAWVRPYPTMALDLEKFSRITMDLFCYQDVEAHLEVQVQKNEVDVRTVRIPGTIKKVWDDNWAEMEFVLNDKVRNVVKMKLVFDVDRPVKGVNIDRILLWPKE